jgi:hypothetical protein
MGQEAALRVNMVRQVSRKLSRGNGWRTTHILDDQTVVNVKVSVTSIERPILSVRI